MDLERVDPALREATRNLPSSDASKAWVRTMIRLATRVMPVPRFTGIDVSSGRANGVPVRVYVPVGRLDGAALLWIHGGGFLIGDARQDETLCAETALDLGITVVSANYRLAPEHPFPAALDDVATVWTWMLDNASDLHIDPYRIAVGGESAGAGVAASLVQRIADDGGTQPLGQWLFAPMLDDRTAADPSFDPIDHWVWNNRSNRIGWTAYLNHAPGADTVATYASPARRRDLSGLPAAFIAVGDIELFFAEDEEYASRLTAAGVDVELDVVKGAPHGFENWARDTNPAQALKRRARQWLHSVLLVGEEGGA